MSVLSAAQNWSTSNPAGASGPFLELLSAQRSSCVDELAQVAEELLQHGPDTVLLARRASLERTLEQVEAALARIDAGTYGACVDCGVAIPVERLELRPHAATCVPCTAAG